MKMRFLLTLGLFVTLLGLGAPTALAAPRAVCISTGTGNWSVTGTWSCNQVPTSADIVIINDGHTVTLDTDGVAYQLIVGGGTSGALNGGTQQLSVGAGGVSVSSGGTFTASTSLMTITGGDLKVNSGGTFIASTGAVTINNGNLSNNGTFTVPSNQITINNGNLSNNGTFNHNNGTIQMLGTSIQSISGVGTFNNLQINNSAGVNLTSGATVLGTLTLNYDLNVASGAVLTMGSNSSTSGVADVVGKVRRTAFTTGTAYTFGSAYTTITFTDGTPPSEITVELFKTAPGGLANAVQRYYSITPTGGSGYTFTLRLHYRDAEVPSGMPEGDLQMWQQVNGRWTLRARTSNDTGYNWVEKTGLTSFSLWALSNSGAPTAVTLSAFAARADAPDALPFVGALAAVVLGAVVWRKKDKGRKRLAEG